MGQRRRARECALQMLFQIDIGGSALDDVFQQFWINHDAENEVRSFAERLVRGVLENRRDLDTVIAGSADNWRVERMAVVDRNLLRMSTYEMLFEEATPAAVAIDEAIEIAKKFGAEESGSFINGILDAVKRRIDRGEIVPGG